VASSPLTKRYLEITKDGPDKGRIMVEVTIGNCILRRWPTEKESKSLQTEGAAVMKAVTEPVKVDEESGDLVIDKVDAPKKKKKTKGKGKKVTVAPKV